MPWGPDKFAFITKQDALIVKQHVSMTKQIASVAKRIALLAKQRVFAAKRIGFETFQVAVGVNQPIRGRVKFQTTKGFQPVAAGAVAGSPYSSNGSVTVILHHFPA